MAGPGGRPVGRVSVRVVPDTSTFAKSLEAYLQRLENRLKVQIPVSLDAKTVAATEAKLATLTRDRKIKIGIDVDRAGLKGIPGLDGKGPINNKGGGFNIGFLSPAVIGGIAAAIAGLAAALPGLLAAVGAPLAAIIVGFDGIKRAAQGLALPFQVLQTAVSNTFEKAFLPGMQNLEKIFPVLGAGLAQIGTALGGMFTQLTAALTSPQGLAMISTIFNNISKALTILAPAMGPFVDAFLRLAVSGTQAFVTFAPLLADVITKFAEFIAFLDRIGALDLAMKVLGATMFILVAAFTSLVMVVVGVAAVIGGVAAAFMFMMGVAKTVIAFIVSIPARIGGGLAALPGIVAGVFRNAWTQAKTAVVTKFNEIMTTIRGWPAKAVAGLKSLPGLLKTAAKNAWNAFWNEIKRIGADIISWVTGWAGRVAGAAAKALAIFSPSKVMMGLGKNTMLGFQIGLEKNAQGPLDAMTEAANAVGGIKPNVNTTQLLDQSLSTSVTDMRMQARLNAEELAAIITGDRGGKLQLLAAGG